MNTMKRKGFTLVELLVVIAILAILATVSVVGYTSFIEGTAVRVDADLATQLNHFLAAYKVDHRDIVINEDNVDEVTAELLELGGIESLDPQADQYGYHFYYDFKEEEYVSLHDNVALGLGDGVVGKTMKAWAEGEEPAYANRVGNSFTDGRRYYLVDTAGSYASVLNQIYDFSGDYTDLATLYNTTLASFVSTDGTDLGTAVKSAMNDLVFITNSGNFVIDLSNTHTIPIVNFTETEEDVVVKRLKTDINGNQAQINASNPLVTIQVDTTIEIPGDTKLVANALVIATANGATANVVIDAESWVDIYENVDAGFTNSSTIVTVGGQDYVVDGEKVYDSTGAEVGELMINFTVASFNLKIVDTNLSDKVLNRTDIKNEGYVAIDIDGGFTFDFIDALDEEGGEASMSTVTWEILELVVAGTKLDLSVVDAADYITIAGNNFKINTDDYDCLYPVDSIKVKATSDEPIDKYVPEDQLKYAEQTYSLNIVRVSGLKTLSVGNDSLLDSVAELVCNGGAATNFAISAEVQYNHTDADGTPIGNIIIDTSITLEYTHEHTEDCCNHQHDDSCESVCTHTEHTSECMDCAHKHTDFNNYCCGHTHTDACYTGGTCSHMPGGDHGGANSPCLIPNHHNCLTTEACLTNCSHISGGNHLDANGRTGTESECFTCTHAVGTDSYKQDYALTAEQSGTYDYKLLWGSATMQKYACRLCPNYKEDGSHWCYSVCIEGMSGVIAIGEVYEIKCSTSCCQTQTKEAAQTHTHGGDACYTCKHETHVESCKGTCSHTTHTDECYNCTHPHTEDCVNVCTHTHTATECDECTHKCTDDPNNDGTKGDCLKCTHACSESKECGDNCNHIHHICTDACEENCELACDLVACLDRQATVVNSSNDTSAMIVGKGDCQGKLTITIAGHYMTIVDISIYDSFDIKINNNITHVGSIDDAANGVITKEKDENDKEYDVINVISGNTIKVEDLFKSEIPEDAIIMIFGEYNADDSLMNVDRAPLTLYSDALAMGATCWTADNVITRDANGVWEEIQLYGTRDEEIYIAVLIDAVFDENTGKLLSAKRISEDVTVKVVEGKNVRDYADLNGSANNVLLDDIRIPNTTNAAKTFALTGKTLYGNHHTFNIENGATSGWGIIILKNAHLQDLRVIGAFYPKVTVPGDEEYGSNAVYATGVSSLKNCYVSNCRAPIMAGQEDNNDENGNPTDVITLENCVFYGGRYCNIDLRNGTLKLVGEVITINQPHTNEKNVTASTTKEIGLGVVVWLEANYGTNIQGLDNLVQYNFVPSTYQNFQPITFKKDSMTINVATQDIFDQAFEDDDAIHKFGTGTTYLNSGILGADIGEGLSGVIAKVSKTLPYGDRTGFNDDNPATGRTKKTVYTTPSIEHADSGQQTILNGALGVLGALGARAEMHFYTFADNATNQAIFTASQNAEYIYSPWDQTVAGHEAPYAAYDFGADGDILTVGK